MVENNFEKLFGKNYELVELRLIIGNVVIIDE